MDHHPQEAPAITLLLQKWRQGDSDAFAELTQYVYHDLRRRASAYLRQERPGHTLETSGLVHEAFIKLIDKQEVEWHDRNHFFAIAAQVMRRILIDHARARKRQKRGGKGEDLPLDEVRAVPSSNFQFDLLGLDEALLKLATFDERQARIVELKYFGGLTLEETANVLGVSPVTVKRDWQIAKAWLRAELK